MANTLIRLLVIILYYWEVQARYSTTIAVVSLLGLILVAVALNAGDSDSERPPRPQGMIVVSEEQMEQIQERQQAQDDVDPGTWDPETGSYSWEEDSS